MDQGYWEMIPTEILEKILLDVPTYQIPFNGTFVCKRWTTIILKPQFWVHKMKLHGISIDEKIWSVLNEFENNKIVSCLYNASLYQEHRTQQTPLSNLVLNIPIDEDVEPEKNWVILDDFGSMLLAAGVLICRSHWSQWYIYLYLKNKDIKALPHLLKLLEAREVPIAVRDDYTFWNFTPRIDYLQILKGSVDEAKSLDQFRGCLPALGLPSMGDVILSIGVDDQNVAIDPGFSRIEEYPYPVLHLKAGTNFSNLPKIPVPPESYILVSGLEESHILWMTDVTKRLSNNGHTLVFFNYQLDLKSSENLLNKMARAGLDSYGILCSSRTLSSESENILNELACRLFSHWFSGFQLCDNDNDLICHLDQEGISSLLGIDDVDYY